MDPKRIVRSGYERAAAEYERWSAHVDADPRQHYVALVSQHLSPRARILELGCGTGLATRRLATRFHVTGVDFSGACLALARTHAPSASYLQADITGLGIRPHSMDAVVAFYSLIHVPREEQPDVVRDARIWLRPGGLLLATMGTGDRPIGFDDDWRGVPMYWSSYNAATNVALVRDAGFEILHADDVSQDEDGEVVTFLWIVARSREP